MDAGPRWARLLWCGGSGPPCVGLLEASGHCLEELPLSAGGCRYSGRAYLAQRAAFTQLLSAGEKPKIAQLNSWRLLSPLFCILGCVSVTLCHAASFMYMYVKQWVPGVQPKGLIKLKFTKHKWPQSTDSGSVAASLQPGLLQEEATGGGNFNLWQIYSGKRDKRMLNPAPRMTQEDETQSERHNKPGFSGVRWRNRRVTASLEKSSAQILSFNPWFRSCAGIKLQALIVKSWALQ